MRGALQRYRVVANVVGVVLVVFLLIAVPLRYLGGEPRLSHTISPIHGFLYVVYLGLTVDLARRAGWSTLRTLGVALAGTVPFLSFVVERRMTRDVQAQLA
jgi:integral membrane protein